MVNRLHVLRRTMTWSAGASVRGPHGSRVYIGKSPLQAAELAGPEPGAASSRLDAVLPEDAAGLRQAPRKIGLTCSACSSVNSSLARPSSGRSRSCSRSASCGAVTPMAVPATTIPTHSSRLQSKRRGPSTSRCARSSSGTTMVERSEGTASDPTALRLHFRSRPAALTSWRPTTRRRPRACRLARGDGPVVAGVGR